jgi:hypothetical protein
MECWSDGVNTDFCLPILQYSNPSVREYAISTFQTKEE